jgi:hypothetical protein
MRVLPLRLTAAAFGLFAATIPLAAEEIGVASTVASNVTGTVGANTGAVTAGDPLYVNEAIVSDGNGSAQFLFIDETVFNIGPNSSVVLDEFVYNASQGTGSVLLNVSQGAFRFITGSATPESYTIRTPTATIGLRGTIFEGVVDAALTIIELIKGKLYLCPVQGSTVEGQGLEQTRQRNEGECELVEDPGLYYIGADASGASSGGPGDPDDPDDPNDGADNLDDPFHDHGGRGGMTCINCITSGP